VKESLETELQQARETLETVGTIAHDLNNLLSSMIGYAGMLALALPPDAEAQGDVKQIQVAGERAAALVRQLRASVHRDQ
jgi:signal transduction histidine kinase